MTDVDSGRRAEIESVEVKVADPEEIAKLSKLMPAGLETYFEISPSSAAECIPLVATCGRGAKIRTGGETADKFPAPASVVEFIRLCLSAKVPFKATAGLHHPLRSVHRLTYQPEALCNNAWVSECVSGGCVLAVGDGTRAGGAVAGRTIAGGISI